MAKQFNLPQSEAQVYSRKHTEDKNRKLAWAEWFEQTTHYQKQALNLIYACALQEGYDVDNLIVDLGQDVREAILHDDGKLPAGHPATANGTGVGGKGSLCYSFKEHRPLTGQEELLARCGFPPSRLNLRSFKDSELLRLAKLASPLPTTAATLCALIAVIGKFPHSSGSGNIVDLALSRKEMEKLLGILPVPEAAQVPDPKIEPTPPKPGTLSVDCVIDASIVSYSTVWWIQAAQASYSGEAQHQKKVRCATIGIPTLDRLRLHSVVSYRW